MNLIRELWNAVTYRNEWTNASPRFPAGTAGKTYDLLMIEVDREGKKLRIGGARAAEAER